MARKIIVAVIAVWLFASGVVLAQESAGPDPIGEALIPPDVIMTHQQALGLSDAQAKSIQADVQSAQQRFSGLQWRISAATEKLVSTLKQNHVDQSKAIAQLDAVLDLEREIKHTQLTMMIQVKNELTPQQQAMARQFAGAGSK